jgi:large subunit ribosomal protein L5
MVKEKNNYQPRLLIKYNEIVQKYLADRLGIKNKMRIPKIEKIVLNMGIGDAKEHKNWLTSGVEELTTIAGQKAVVTNSKKAISNFKIREGDPVGIRVTLRSEKMYEFVDRFISVASPRIRDFRGLPTKGFDGRGNYNFGVNEQIIFPEIDYDKINNIKGMNISIVTTGKTDEEAYELLIAMGFPIRQKKMKIEESAEEIIEGIENTPAEMQDEDRADETPVDEVEIASDVEDNKEETSEEEETPEKKPVEADEEEVKTGEESVSEDSVEGIENTPAAMDDEDKADETRLDAVEEASDVEDNIEETYEEEEETPKKGSNV